MSKTILSVLEVAAVAAVQLIPGVGQAVGIAVGVSAAAGAAIATAGVIGLEAIANSTIFAPKQAKAASTEPAEKPLRHLLDAFDDADSTMATPAMLGRSTRNDLFEIDRHAAPYLPRA